MEAHVCLACRQRDRRIAALQAEVERLRQQLDEACRAGKRQAAPFAKQPPKAEAKRPGRKPGDAYGRKGHRPPPAAEQVDEVHEAPLPDACPECGGPVEECHVAFQYQTDIPRKPIHRRFNVHVGRCRSCHRRLQGRHPLQTSDALGAAAAQLGPDAQAAVVELNKQAGLPHGKVSRCLESLFGIPLSRGGSAQAVLRAARRAEPVYAGLRDSVAAGDRVALDETGWHVGGQPAWLHALVGPEATVYVVDPTRAADVAAGVLGWDYAGALVHDGWAAYDRFKQAVHQQCLAHPLRRCRELLQTATRGAVYVPRAVSELLQAGLALRDRHAAGEVSDHGLAVARGRLAWQLSDLVGPAKTDAANERLAAHLWRHLDEWFTFLRVPGLDATNWRAELAIRFGVIYRKVWGGNRTWAGAKAQATQRSVWRTCWQQGRSALDDHSQLLRGQPVALAQPP
jgi:transposase